MNLSGNSPQPLPFPLSQAPQCTRWRQAIKQVQNRWTATLKQVQNRWTATLKQRADTRTAFQLATKDKTVLLGYTETSVSRCPLFSRARHWGLARVLTLVWLGFGLGWVLVLVFWFRQHTAGHLLIYILIPISPQLFFQMEGNMTWTFWITFCYPKENLYHSNGKTPFPPWGRPDIRQVVSKADGRAFFPHTVVPGATVGIS